MIIALDLDGVFRNFTGALIRQFKLDYPHLSFQIPQFESQIIKIMCKAHYSQFSRHDISNIYLPKCS